MLMCNSCLLFFIYLTLSLVTSPPLNSNSLYWNFSTIQSDPIRRRHRLQTFNRTHIKTLIRLISTRILLYLNFLHLFDLSIAVVEAISLEPHDASAFYGVMFVVIGSQSDRLGIIDFVLFFLLHQILLL